MTAESALAPKDAACYLGMCPNKLRRLSRDGLIPCRNINPGGEKAAYRYSPKALDRWLEGDDEPKVSPSRSHSCRNMRQRVAT